MRYQQVFILLPCHSLEDFPLHHEGAEAAGLLAGWTAMWRPELIVAAGALPTWARADDPPEELADRLLIVPQASESLLLAGWVARARDEGGRIIRRKTDRDEIVAAALDGLDEVPRADEDLAAEFLALGYAYLEEELLTRQMRYMSNLDETHFEKQVVQAAQAAVEGRRDEAEERLANCFDVLTEARERYYPAETSLVDLTLLAPTTIGQALRDELAADSPLNLLLSGETLEAMAAGEPESLAALKAALQRGNVTVVGGEFCERETTLLPPESLLEEFRAGRESYRRHLGMVPDIYARRRFGLTPLLPQILARSGFIGALSFTLDEGRFPRDDQAKSRWEGIDSSGIDTLAKVPLDVGRPETFLSLCEKLSETMDYDHVATVCFARWPGGGAPWFGDLRRIARRAPVLGRFVTLKDYFASSDSPGAISKFDSDQYRSPFLKQAIIRRRENPLSRFADEHRRSQQMATLGALATLNAVAGSSPESHDELFADVYRTQREEDLARLGELDERLDRQIEQAFQRRLEALSGGGEGRGYLVYNPLNVARRIGVELPELDNPPEIAGAVQASQAGKRQSAVVDLPPLGHVWLSAGSGRPPRKRKGELPLADAESLMLRNEFMEVYVDRHTGAMRALRDYKQRRARLSQQIALRQPGARPRPGDAWRDPDETAEYSIMAADSVEVTAADQALGEIVSRGRLMGKDGRRLAGFSQTLRLWRASRTLWIDVELDVDEEPRADPWNSYYAARFAWSDIGAAVYRSVGVARVRTDLKRIESPYFVESRTETGRTVILTGGLPFHRLVSGRILDTLLVSRGETRRKFSLGLAIDPPHPLNAALELLAPPLVAFRDSAPSETVADGGFRLDAKNVVATAWSPLVEDGAAVGFRVRLMETEGRCTRATLATPRPVSQARQLDFRGETLAQLPVEEQSVKIDFDRYEWADVEARFA